MTKKSKDVLINLRINSRIRDEFRVAAGLRGASVSGLLHQFIVQTIREERERNPRAFIGIDKDRDNKEKNNRAELTDLSAIRGDEILIPVLEALDDLPPSRRRSVASKLIRELANKVERED
jgi:hypothetical protein